MTQKPDYIPADYDRIEVVEGFTALRGGCTGRAFARFDGEVNCRLWSRKIGETFNFNALAAALRPLVADGSYRDLGAADLLDKARDMEEAAKKAAEFIAKEDMAGLLRETGHSSILRVINNYNDGNFITVEGAQLMHTDGINGGLLLAGYTEPMTPWLRNDQARSMGGLYTTYLANDGAQVQSFRPGDIWCHAGTGDTAHPFIHGGPAAPKDGVPRLLLVGGPKA